MTKEQLLFALLRSELGGGAADDSVKNNCTNEVLEQVCALAIRHDLAHIVGQAMSRLGLPKSEPFLKCREIAKQAVFRYVRLSTEYERICKLFENVEIPFIPLKGSILREYYPEPWMRTSCDIDILVKQENLHNAAEALRKELLYTGGELIGDHDVALLSPGGVRLELHYDTVVESDAVMESRAVLSRVWEDATPAEAGGYRYEMSDEMFYFYHIAHMAKHLQNGGCGIRPFADMWILRHRVKYDEAARKQLLDRGGLLTFAEAAERLSEAWFSGKDMDTLSRSLADYILSGGVYGSLQNSVAVQQSKQGGRFGYALRRIFLPYETIKFYFPVLQKRKWLLPVYQVVRWCKLLFNGGVKRSVHELQVNGAMSREETMSAGKLLQYLGLK